MNPGLESFGAPPDAVAWGALCVAAVLLAWAALPAPRRASVTLLVLARPRLWLLFLALAAALLSAGYVAFYLRGGPRIIDATSYFLEARALAAGSLAFDVPEPSGSFRGRFLLTPPEGSRVGVLFPPGWPALLALGFLAGAPLAVGPLLGAALVVATYLLARDLFVRREIALLAAAVSATCAALRYHTADTMSHGWAALLLTTTLVAARRGGGFLALAGLCAGLCVATRPMTGVVAIALGAAVAWRPGARRALAAFALASAPGIALLLAHGRATTGALLGSSQLRYYALADGPPGCFRWGFGSGIGCQFEHGDFVRAHLSDGYGLIEALGTTGRRLLWHFLDVANAEPLTLLVFAAVVLGRRDAGVRLLGLTVLGVMLVYAPFYFDGSYPGGGARLFADALPVEHVLLAWGAHRLRVIRFVLPVALLGFALRSSYGHVALAEREGGRPMFEPSALHRAGVERGLVYVDTDHGFALGHDPAVRDPYAGVIVARRRDDAHDYALWTALGRPESRRYDRGPSGVPTLMLYTPPVSHRFEAEAEWPPLAVREGWAHPDYLQCASGGRLLRLRPGPGGRGRIELAAWVPSPGRYRPRAGWVLDGNGTISVQLPGTRFSPRDPNTRGCVQSEGPELALEGGPIRWFVEVQGGSAAIDFLELRPLP